MALDSGIMFESMSIANMAMRWAPRLGSRVPDQATGPSSCC